MRFLVVAATFWGLAVAAPPAAAAVVEWERTPYNQVETSEAAGTITMTAVQRPAGLSFTAELDPTKTYRLRVRGRTDAAGIVMRLRADDRLTYLRAPNGLYSARYTGTSELEVLLFRHYPEDDERYRILEVSAEECTDQCARDVDLRAEILRERPALQPALDRGDRLAAATEVSRWVAGRMPVPGGAPPLLARTDGLSAAELWYDTLQTGEVGVFCGGISAVTLKILDLFDITGAFELDFGDPDLYTHATVVLNAGSAASPEWHLLDPTFGAVLRAPNSGAPLPLPEALEAWRAGRMDLVEVDTIDLEGRRIASDPDGDGAMADLRCDGDVASGWSGCSLGHLAHDFDDVFAAAGLGRGYGAILGLFARGDLFSTAFFGTPSSFVAMHDRLRSALADNRPDVHVADLPLGPRLQTQPAVAGMATVGGSLVLDDGRWVKHPGRHGGADPEAAGADGTITWLRCASVCTAIPGHDGATYRVTAEDVGHRLTARVTVSNRWGSRASEAELTPVVAGAEPRPSDHTGTVPAAPAPAGGPPPRVRARATVRGRPSVGRLLRCDTLGVPARARFRWLRDGRRVHGVSGRRYRVRARDRGRRLRCEARHGSAVVRSPAVRVAWRR